MFYFLCYYEGVEGKWSLFWIGVVIIYLYGFYFFCFRKGKCICKENEGVFKGAVCFRVS